MATVEEARQVRDEPTDPTTWSAKVIFKKGPVLQIRKNNIVTLGRKLTPSKTRGRKGLSSHTHPHAYGLKNILGVLAS